VTVPGRPGAGPDHRGTGRTVAVIVAAGDSDLPGAPVPLLLAPLAGRPLIEHSVAAFDAAPWVDEILVVVPSSLAGPVRRLLTAGRYRKEPAVVEGGATRPDSTRLGVPED